MRIEVVLKAAQILRALPGHTMPLSRLHAQLQTEFGTVGSYADLYHQLKKQADSFMLVDTARMLSGRDGWSGMVRERYDSVLDGVGLGSCVRVTLTELPETESSCEIVAALSATMGCLTPSLAADPSLREFTLGAAHQLAEISRIMDAAAGRPTIQLPDPQRAE